MCEVVSPDFYLCFPNDTNLGKFVILSTSGIEHLSCARWHMRMSSLEDCLLLRRKSFLDILDMSLYHIYDLQICSPILWIVVSLNQHILITLVVYKATIKTFFFMSVTVDIQY